MIYEYAIDPAFLLELADKPDLASSLCRVLRIGSNCITSGYPESFKDIAITLIKDKENMASDPRYKAKWQERRKKVTELAATLTQTIAKRHNASAWDCTFTNEHMRLPFEGILSLIESSNAVPYRGLAWLRTPACHLFDCPSSVLTLRTAQNLCNAIDPLLKNASDLIFIDPYFSSESRYTVPYSHYFSSIQLANNIRTNGKRKLTIVCNGMQKDRKYVLPVEFERSCETMLYDIMPTQTELKIYRIKEIQQQQQIHNRYILTDIGGVSFGHGTDDSQNHSYDDINLLSAHQLTHWRTAYTPGSTHFDWSESPVTISKP